MSGQQQCGVGDSTMHCQMYDRGSPASKDCFSLCVICLFFVG